jgi:hypothetical protein
VVGFGGPSKFRDAIRGGFSKGLTNNVRSRGRKTYRVVPVRLPRGHRGIELPRSFSLSLSLSGTRVSTLTFVSRLQRSAFRSCAQSFDFVLIRRRRRRARTRSCRPVKADLVVVCERGQKTRARTIEVAN